MSKPKFENLKNRLKEMMPENPFPRLGLKPDDQIFLEENTRKLLKEELNQITHP